MSRGRRSSPTSSAAFRMSAMRSSVHVLSAVDRQGRARDETGILVNQEGYASGDLVGAAQPINWNARDDLPEYLLRHRGDHVRVDVSGRNRIDGDAGAGALLGQRLGEAVDAGLGRGIVHLAIL